MSNVADKSSVIASLFWKLMERGGTQGIQFIVQIILARILTPDDYGIISLIAVFILIANVFVQNGFNTALIQKKDADEIDFSSVFYLSLFVALVLYLILFIAAPYIGGFYGITQLTSVLRVLAFTLVLGAFNSIQNAYIARNMNFKKLFFSSLGAIIVSGLMGIVLAYKGFGVWALVIQQLGNQFFITLILWFTVKWRPKLLFSFQRIRGLFSYGWKLLVSAQLDTLYMNLRSLIIGKMYSSGMLGFYNRSEQFPSIIVSNINGSIQAVMLPAMSSHQDDCQRVKAMVRRAVVTSSFLLFPMMAGLAAAAKPLVKLLLTDKWLPCVPFLQIFCAVYALWPIHTANLQAINAMGRSDVFLKLEIIKKILGVIILAATIYYGVYAITVGLLVSGIISIFINAYPNIRLLGYSFSEQFRDILPPLLLALAMGLAVASINLLNMVSGLTLAFQLIAGITLYFTLSRLLKLECYTYLINTLKEMLRSRG